MVMKINASRKTNTPRAAWSNQYRALRAAHKLWNFMLIQNGGKRDDFPSFMESTPGWERFDFCRLHGDDLHAFGPHLGRVQHLPRMNHLRQRVRLP
jgi:hypothetical protein